MKKIFTLLLLLAMMMGKNAKAQYVTIPDGFFVNWLNSHGYSSAMNGNQLNTQDAKVLTDTILRPFYSSITDLTGIQYFVSLKHLDCSNSHITNLSTLPSGLLALYCDHNLLTNIPSLPPNLLKLDCDNNYLTSLPALPSSLLTFDCGGNQLTSLPILPSNLLSLVCDWNNADSLPTLPSGLLTLSCRGNQLSSLPTLPSTLTSLDCVGNLLASLPTLPSSLNYLICNNNQLSSLPLLPSSLSVLECYKNQLSSLPPIPDSLGYLYCFSNQIHCLPDLKNIHDLVCDRNQINCIPGNHHLTSGSGWQSLPICNLFNSNNCKIYWNINGLIYIDKNSSCTYNSTDTVLKNIKIELWRNGILEQQTTSRPDGSYAFDVTTFDTFQIKIDTTNLPYYLSCPTQQVLTSIISAIDSLDANMNFALQCKSVNNDVVSQNIISTRHRPGRLNNIVLSEGYVNSIYGYNCASTINSGKVKLFKNGPIKFKQNSFYSTQPTVISADSLIWNVADFNNFPTNLNLSLQVDTTAQIGQSVCYTLVVVPNTPDANPNDDTLHICFPIMNGYDPNVKTAQLNVNDSTINYTVQFQNTGNDTAINIIVRDTLSNQLDVASLQITGYSHQPVTQTFGNKIVFNFPQINLVDSATNEPLSHGFVSFNVKVLPTVTTNSIVPNQAAIYFDLNPAIYTNTTQTAICYQPSSATINASICPIQSYTFNNHQLTTSGIYFDTLVNYVGCDSILQLNLNIINTKRDIYKTLCNGSSYFFNGKNRTTSGIYKDTMAMGTGCDSLLTLHLSVLPIIRKSKLISICGSDSIYFKSNFIHQTGLYKDTLSSYLGCDSIAILVLTVLPEIRTTLFTTSCGNHPIYFNNHLLTTTGMYDDTLQSYLGCDSFITMNFTYKPISQTTLTQSICSNQNFNFNNHNITSSGIYYDTLQNYLGCDSIISLQLIVNSTSSSSFIQTICNNQSYTFNNKTLSTSGIYYDTLPNYLGCDSFITLHFTIQPISQTTLTQSICSNQTFNFNNHNLTASGIYYDTLTNYVGCDSLVILNFTYHLISNKTINQTICNNQIYFFNHQHLNSSGIFYDTMPNTNGCDSFITLHLTVLPTSSSSINQTLCSGQSYFFHHTFITVGGTFKDTVTNYLGCDSIITLHLTVLPVTSSAFNQTICFGNSIIFNQQICNQSGSYFDTIPNYVGCDSVIAMHLVVLPFNHTFVQASFCQGSSYTFNGKTYSINGIYDDTLIAINGCDSAITLLLGIKTVDTSVLVTPNSLIATATNSYFQWIDCSTYQNIAGANDSIFYPQSVGNYAVVVQSKQNLCTDTSACYHFGNVGMEQVSINNRQLRVYPNPVKDELLVVSYQLLVNTIEVTNLLGEQQNVKVEKLNTENYKLRTEYLANGIYFIKALDSKGNILNGKFVKE